MRHMFHELPFAHISGLRCRESEKQGGQLQNGNFFH